MTKQRFYSLAVSIALCAAMGNATWADTRLDSKDGSFVLKGKILNVTDDDYTIQTEMGEMTVRREFVDCSGDFCPDESGGQNGTVTLTSGLGDINIEGQLINVDQDSYYIQTPQGELTVSRAFVTCEGEACPTVDVVAGRFSLVGPSVVGAVMLTEMVKSFSAEKGYQLTESFSDGGVNLLVGSDAGELVSQFSVSGKPTAEAVKALLDDQASFAITLNPATPEMLSQLTGQKVNAVEDVLTGKVVGLDAMVVVTHPSNPINTMSTNDVADIISGKISNWSQLGGPDQPITLHIGADGTELAGLTLSKLAPGQKRAANASQHQSSTDIRKAVSIDPLGIGVVYRSQIGDLRQVALSSACNIHFAGSDFSVQANEYPFGIEIYAYTKKGAELDAGVKNLLAYVDTDQGQQQLSGMGLVSQALKLAPMRDQGARMLTSVISAPANRSYDATLRRYLTSVADGTRLSTALHFVTGSSQPDARSIQDIERISDFVRQSANQGQKLTVIGFSDSYGSFNPNVALSAGRAESIKSELLARNRGWLEADDVEVLGVGPIAPVGCNETERGRELNRRVEIWVSPKR